MFQFIMVMIWQICWFPSLLNIKICSLWCTIVSHSKFSQHHSQMLIPFILIYQLVLDLLSPQISTCNRLIDLQFFFPIWWGYSGSFMDFQTSLIFICAHNWFTLRMSNSSNVCFVGTCSRRFFPNRLGENSKQGCHICTHK